MTASIRGIATETMSLGTTFDLAIPDHQPGDHVYCLVLVYATFDDTITECGALDIPSPWTLSAAVDITESATIVGRAHVLTTIAGDTQLDAVTFTTPIDASQRIAFCAGVSVKDAGGTPGLDSVITGPWNTDDAQIPAITVHQEDTIVAAAAVTVGIPPGKFSVEEPYGLIGKQEQLVLYGASVNLWQTAALDTSVPATDTVFPTPLLESDGSTGWYIVAALPVIPAPASGGFVPSTLDLSRLRLRCADDYRAYITEGDYETVIDSIPWSDIEWSRVLDESGTATVTSPDRLGGIRCISHLGGLRPWRHGLKIERNDVSVWRGPVTQLRRQQGAIQITANDILARFTKRLATRQEEIVFSNTDAGVAFATILLSAQIEGEAWGLTAPDIATLAPFSREIRGTDLELAWDILQDLGEAAIDFWIGDGVLYAHEFGTGWKYHDGFGSVVLDGPYNQQREFIYGTFNERTFTGTVLWSMNGMAQGNSIWVAGADTGEEGARDVYLAIEPSSVAEDGTLDIVASGNLHQPGDVPVPDGVFQLQAASILAQRAHTPAVIEATPLAEGAPMDIPNLRPGSIWFVDIWDHCYGQLLQRTRLKRVQVRVTKNQQGEVEETVVPTLYPVGYESTL